VTTRVHVWTDPSCPWAWQTFRWLRSLERDGAVRLSFGLFSLELNASEPDLPFERAAARYGTTLTLLALAREEGDDDAFGRLYEAIGTHLHERGEKVERVGLDDVAIDAGLDAALLRRALDDRLRLGEVVTKEFHDARTRDVFGVPTLAIDDDKVVYGPILAVGPTGDEAHTLFAHVKALADRGSFFELKRWPRDLRPGGAPVGNGG
jgi:predicted DsbA family dithiol-disulfide isomerase